MTIELVGRFVARHFGGVGTSRASFARIHVWAIVFLMLATLVSATHGAVVKHGTRGGNFKNLATDANDPRLFLPSPFAKRDFHIAWIAGSESEVQTTKGPQDSVPHRVLPSIPKIDGRKAVIDLYQLPAMRVADEYFTLLDALSHKPDMIVMSLNPVWSLNPIGVHSWNLLDEHAATRLITKPRGWPIAASIVSPSDLAFGLAAKLRPFQQRWYYSQKLHDVVDDLGPLDRTHLEAENAAAILHADRTTTALAQGALAFWFIHRYHATPQHPFAANGIHGMTANLWAGWMDPSNELDNSLNRAILRGIGAELKASKTPSYVYLAQINDDWLRTNPEIRSATAGVEAQLRHEQGDFAASNIMFQPETVARFASGMRFLPGDPVHLDAAGSIPEHLARQLCTLLARTGHSAPCSSSTKGDTNG